MRLRQFTGQFIQVVKVEIKQAVLVEKVAFARNINGFYLLLLILELGAKIIERLRCLFRRFGIDDDQYRLVVLGKSFKKTGAIL
ncbi:MAG: hypothetical protein Q7T96_11835 [Methylobacter sp.]|nr:hypothetical protein [Methylobacter sp.]